MAGGNEIPCTYSFSKITATEKLFSVLWLEVQISLQKAHHFVSATPCTLDVCSQSVQASAGSKCCAHVLSVPGAMSLQHLLEKDVEVSRFISFLQVL